MTFRTTAPFPLVLLALATFLRAQDSDVRQAEISIQEAIQAGDLSSASRLVGHALEQHPGEGGLWNLRGIVHARRNEVPEARKDFAAAVRLAPRLLPAWQNLARACQLDAENGPARHHVDWPCSQLFRL